MFRSDDLWSSGILWQVNTPWRSRVWIHSTQIPVVSCWIVYERFAPQCCDPPRLQVLEQSYTGNGEHSGPLTTSLNHRFLLSSERTVQLPGCSLSSFQRYFCPALQRQNCPFGDEREKFLILWRDEMMRRIECHSFDLSSWISPLADNVVIKSHLNWICSRFYYNLTKLQDFHHS